MAPETRSSSSGNFLNGLMYHSLATLGRDFQTSLDDAIHD